MRIFRYRQALESLPVDPFADPDGEWTFETLVEAAGFDLDDADVSISVLTDSFLGHPDGCAVVSTPKSDYLAVIDCVPEPVRLPLRQRHAPVVERAA